MRTTAVSCCALLLAGCATAPSPGSFRAPLLGDDRSEAASEGDTLQVDGPVDVQSGSTASMPSSSTSTEPLGDRHVTALLGRRKLDDNTFDNLDIDEPWMFGLQVDMSDHDTGHGLEAGFEYSNEDNSVGGQDVEATLFDVYGGYRHTFQLQEMKAHPYVGGGLAIVHGDVDIGPSDDDDTLGAYVRAGINWDVGDDGLRLGVDYRHLWADLDLFGGDVDADFDQLALTLGFPF